MMRTNDTCKHCVGSADRVGGQEWCGAAKCESYSRFVPAEGRNFPPEHHIGKEIYWDGELITIKDIAWAGDWDGWHYYSVPYAEATTFLNNCLFREKEDMEKLIAEGLVRNCLDCSRYGKCSSTDRGHASGKDRWNGCLIFEKTDRHSGKEE